MFLFDDVIMDATSYLEYHEYFAAHSSPRHAIKTYMRIRKPKQEQNDFKLNLPRTNKHQKDENWHVEDDEKREQYIERIENKSNYRPDTNYSWTRKYVTY